MAQEAILSMMKDLRDGAETIGSDVPQFLSSPDLTLHQAERILNSVVMHMAGIDRLFEAIEEASDNEAIDPDMEENAAEFAEICHTQAYGCLSNVMDKIRSLGGNPNQTLADAQAKYFS